MKLKQSRSMSRAQHERVLYFPAAQRDQPNRLIDPGGQPVDQTRALLSRQIQTSDRDQCEHR